MLLSFSIENWMSFLNPVSFSMMASNEQQHGLRLPLIKKYKTKILPVAAIYGGNASGKTNFFKAISFAKKLIVEGSQPDSLIPTQPYRLRDSDTEKPSNFTFVILADDTIYEFSFALIRKKIIEEKLIQINSTSEKILYHRLNGSPNFHRSIANNQFLNFAFQGTRDNQLFLTNSVSQKVEDFRPVYDWFKNTLELVAPDSRFALFEHFLNEEYSLYSKMNEALSKLDTGIIRLGGEAIPFEHILIPDSLKTQLNEEVKEGTTVRLFVPPFNERFAVTRKNGELIAKKLVTYHSNSNGTEIRFEMKQESDGTQRLIDLLPSFLEISNKNSTKVYVIDEIDRSLHTLLTRKLIQTYLTNCTPQSRSQLLFTTHDTLLMDQQLLRRDEMWVTERDSSGVSNLFSFSEFKDIRSDKDIRKSYLQGRLGGIPRILLDEVFIDHSEPESLEKS